MAESVCNSVEEDCVDVLEESSPEFPLPNLNPPLISEKDKQEEQYTKILNAFGDYYKKKSKDNHCYKKVFFYVILGLLAFLVIGYIAICVKLAASNAEWKAAIPIVGGATATLLSSILALPNIVATHLFPVGEDNVVVELVAVLRGIDAKTGEPRK